MTAGKRSGNVQLLKVIRNAREGLWFVPLMFAIGAVALNAVTIGLDRSNDHELLPPDWFGDPAAALAILGTVSGSMIALVATVLTITMVVVQLAMQQFSPRIVQTFLKDKPSQTAIGLFVATFVQSMLTMREIVVDDVDPIVPGLSVLVTYIFVIIDIVVLVAYVHHIGRSLRVAALIELAGQRTRDLMDELYPAPTESIEQRDPQVLMARSSGVLTMVGTDRLVALAEQADARIELVPAVGQFVPADSPLARIHGVTVDALGSDEVHDALILVPERTLDQDVAFGLRMLVDMGLKAIAEGPFLDPTTTVQTIDRIHDLMRQLARRDLPDGVHRDARGSVRLLVPTMDWRAFVWLAFDELRLAGAGSPQVSRRLRAALEDLKEVAPQTRQAPLDEQLARLSASLQRLSLDERDVEVAREPDPQGYGVALRATTAEAARTEGE